MKKYDSNLSSFFNKNKWLVPVAGFLMMVLSPLLVPVFLCIRCWDTIVEITVDYFKEAWFGLTYFSNETVEDEKALNAEKEK